jgi:hypothetical protein
MAEPPALDAPAHDVLLLDLPTPKRSDDGVGRLESGLRHQGLSVRRVSLDEARQGRTWASGSTVILPNAPHFPAELADPLRRFIRGGGDVVFIGPRPLGKPTVEIDGRWMSFEKAGPRLAASMRNSDGLQRLLRFDRVTEADWTRDTDRPEAPSRVSGETDGDVRSMKIELRDLRAYDTFAIRLPERLSPDHQSLLLTVRADAQTPQLAVECRTEDGARWIATVDLSARWQTVPLSDAQFRYHGGGSVPPGRQLDLAHVRVVTFGLARGYTQQTPGDHTVWIDELAASPAVVPTPTRFSDFEIHTRASSYDERETQTLDAANRAGDPQALPEAIRYVPVFTVPRYAKSATEFLWTGRDGTPVASCHYHFNGPFAGSNWLILGAGLEQAQAIPEFEAWLAKQIKRRLPAPVPDALRVNVDPSVAVGVTHAAGEYHFTDEDFMNEGAEQLRRLGTRSIKLWMTDIEKAYPFNTEWPQIDRLRDLAEAEPFRKVFAKDFDVYFLVAFSQGIPKHAYWKDGTASDAVFAENEQEFYELTRHLLTEYRGTGKTFVLQSWEGDWLIRPASDLDLEPTPQAVAGMIRFFNARQRGVDRARAELGEHGVRVRHAAEINQVKRSLFGDRQNIIDTVIPHTTVDLVSYSAYDAQQDAAVLRACLEHIRRRLPPKPSIGGERVYIGEFGIPETAAGLGKVQRTLPQVLEVALGFGCPYVVYWELYCNEEIRRPVVQNDDTRGFWLIKPDGSEAWAWHHLQQWIRGER